ncbi:HlyD family efflux transporter periplasmic adaptor subunit [Massilia solisilvae]|uniref:HlyD family efflux transporter periplasmic adaptor subunit n=1 Tax=Massilia solisilvae TaxID=1811225 RepID=A0ABT2BHC3_9BURK|nr:HlyD family efflux transporter periplasmic adaptor subunit [Massilia solisilvae]MCS0607917.1 HlyD family efflux transporter periplasmic adaptor subunit [Massilia solisilvae]
MKKELKLWVPVALVAALAAWAFVNWGPFSQRDKTDGFAKGNGRIEATEVDVATKVPGRISEITAQEGEFVKAGQVLARMDTRSMQAQREEAVARQQQAAAALAGARAEVTLRESDQLAAQALVGQRESDLDAARRRLARSETLANEGASSRQELDDDRARVNGTLAALAAARAQVRAAQAAVNATRTQVLSAQANEKAAAATIARIDAELADTVLIAPRAGRVQYRVAQPGEVLGAGGKVLNLVDLADVYMTFFLPETVAGRVGLGAEVRVVLDAVPQYAIPARVSYVASTAQFTPKTVETASERQKLMFRVKARIDRKLLEAHLQQVKTGLPGVAWVRLDPKAPWPAEVAAKVTP